MTLLKKLGPVAAVGIAVLALAPAALAATVRVNRPCYVAPKPGVGANIGVSGEGYAPGEAVFVHVLAPGGLLAFTETTIAPDGTLRAALHDVSPESIDPIVERKTLQVVGVLSGAVLSEAEVKLTNLTIRTRPSTAPAQRRVTYRFSGFKPGRPIFGHYLVHGHAVLRHKFGKAHGPCGTLKSKARIFPGNARNHHKYGVQFDGHRKYSKRTRPAIVTSVTLGI